MIQQIVELKKAKLMPSMAAYAALLSLAQTTDLNRNQCKYPFSFDAAQKVRSIHEYVMFLLSFLEDFPDKANRWEGKIREVSHEAEDVIELFMWHRIKNKGVSSFKLEEQLRNVTEEIGLIVGDTMDERAPADLLPVAISESSRFFPTGKDAVIGLREDLMAMKDRLCGLSSKLRVIPIVGMGGINCL